MPPPSPGASSSPSRSTAPPGTLPHPPTSCPDAAMRAVIVSLGSARGTHEGQDARATLGTKGLAQRAGPSRLRFGARVDRRYRAPRNRIICHNPVNGPPGRHQARCMRASGPTTRHVRLRWQLQEERRRPQRPERELGFRSAGSRPGPRPSTSSHLAAREASGKRRLCYLPEYAP